MNARLLAAALVTVAATLAVGTGCGPADAGGPPPAPPPPVVDAGCQPACGGKACGDDGCGGSCGACPADATCDAAGACQPVVRPCVPSCGGKSCGPDGCGGTCGSCPAGTGCSAGGLCRALSLNCPAGRTCNVFARHGYAYDCSAGPDACVRTGLVDTYPYADWCFTYACHGGNSTCGDQFGRSDPEVWACHACEASCRTEGEYLTCPLEVEGGCRFDDAQFGGYQIVECICLQ